MGTFEGRFVDNLLLCVPTDAEDATMFKHHRQRLPKAVAQALRMFLFPDFQHFHSLFA